MSVTSGNMTCLHQMSGITKIFTIFLHRNVSRGPLSESSYRDVLMRGHSRAPDKREY